MSTPNIQERKLELIQWVSVIEDVELIDKLSAFKEAESSDWWNEISDEEKASIQKGVQDADAGRIKSHTEAKAIYEKWL